jgi:hypothetical protein
VVKIVMTELTQGFKPAAIKPTISFAELDRIDIRVGTILAVERYRGLGQVA